MDPVLAKQIALGDVDPITHLPMEDIRPEFVPRPLKPLPLVANKGKGKLNAGAATGCILSFFG
jgi:exonuclease-1